MKTTVLIVFAVAAISRVNSLKCYTCSMGENDLDRRCVDDPETVETGSAVTNCDKNYCISIRQEFLDPVNKVASMTRSCVDKPPQTSGIIEDSTFRFYYVACQKDLCNGGSGKDTTNGGGFVADAHAFGNLLVPGTGTSASSNTSQSIRLILFISTIFATKQFLF